MERRLPGQTGMPPCAWKRREEVMGNPFQDINIPAPFVTNPFARGSYQRGEGLKSLIADNRYLIMALIVSVLAGGYTYRIVSRASITEAVVVASTHIPAYERITGSMLTMAYIQPAAIHPGAARKFSEVVDTFASVPILPGEQILIAKTSGSKDSGLSAILSPTDRAMFIPVGVTKALGGGVKRGDKVDVIYVSDERKTGRSVSKVILEGLQVLDVRDDRGRRRDGDRSDSDILGVIVAVDQIGAEKLAFCLENGVVYLAISPYDGFSQTRGGVTSFDVF